MIYDNNEKQRRMLQLRGYSLILGDTKHVLNVKRKSLPLRLSKQKTEQNKQTKQNNNSNHNKRRISGLVLMLIAQKYMDGMVYFQSVTGNSITLLWFECKHCISFEFFQKHNNYSNTSESIPY